MTKHHPVNALPAGYNLHWYEIIRVIGRGGFGITYLARDRNLSIDVAIKEYLPEDFASRLDENTVRPKSQQETMYQWGLERFIDEARTLAKFYHPNIVRVRNVFERNGTAYMVMEYAHGEDLASVYKKRPSFDQEKYLDIFIPIMDGLALIHNAGYIHRDIKPANIYICANDAPLLLDFGSARQSVGHQTRALTSLVTFGYAPFEQYNEGDKKQGPWTDIYSLGASMYVGITGKKPADALKRGGAILDKGIDPYKPLSVVAAGRFKENFLLAIDNALMFKVEDRPGSIMTWADMLLGKAVAPQLPDYVLADEAEAEAETVVLGEERSTPSITGSSSGSQGLVDESGRRISRVEQDNFQAGQGAGFARLTAWVRGLGLSRLQLATAATAAFVAVSIGIYVWQKPSTAVDPETHTVRQEDAVPAQAAPDDNGRVASIERLMVQARQKQQQGLIFQPENDNALYFYSEVLKLDADHVGANKAIAGIHQQVVEEALDQVANNNLAEAEHSINLAETIIAGHAQNKKLKAMLQTATAARKQVNQLLEKANKALRKDKLTAPSNDNAYHYFVRASEIEPDNEQAQKGLQKVEELLITQAKSSLASSDLDQAAGYLNQVETINPNSAELRTLRAQIAQQDQKSQVNSLLAKADAQFSRKYYTSPGDNNAYDTYQRVLKLDPGNRKAKDGITNIKKYYKKRFDKNILDGRLTKAQRDVNIMQRIAGGEWVTRQMQKTLAQKLEQRKPDKPEIELISDLLGEFKSGLEGRNANNIYKISEFSPGRQRFVEQLVAQYRQITVNISGFQYIANTHQAAANVALSDLVDKNGKNVTPGDWSKFPIKIVRNDRQQFKVYW